MDERLKKRIFLFYAAGVVNHEYSRISASYPDPWDPAYKPVPFERTFWVTNGPSYRLTSDMKDLDGARRRSPERRMSRFAPIV